MIHNIVHGGGWIVTVWLMVVGLVACGGIMPDSSSQGGNSADNPASSPQLPGGPDAPVSNMPGQGGGASGSGQGVTGRVLDAAGHAVVGAIVVPQSSDTPPHPIPEIAVMTNNEGRYQWSLPPGQYTFTVHHESYAPTTSDKVTVTPGLVTSLDITVHEH